MAIQSIMHLSFYTNQLEAMRDFYEGVLGAKPKVIVRFGAYKGIENRGLWAKLAESDPNGIAYMFEEVAPGQFLELFPTDAPLPEAPAVQPATSRYTHMSLLVDDIQAMATRLRECKVPIAVEPNIGNSHVWQMWSQDPDGNKIEFMQYTEKSFELTGHIDQPDF